jgi:hypothetical protein
MISLPLIIILGYNCNAQFTQISLPSTKILGDHKIKAWRETAVPQLGRQKTHWGGVGWLIWPTNKRVKKSQMAMRGVQLPVVSTNATTDHKLQGSSVDSIFVHAWIYEKNWAYVVLSRVRTFMGLYMRPPLAFDLKKYAVPSELTEMLLNFENRQPTYFEDSDYRTEFAYIRI